MRSKRPLTIQDQTLNTLREGLRDRRWAGVLPGVRPLAKELGVSIGTLQGALKRLEAEGALAGKGTGFAREIAPSAVSPHSTRVLRVGILPNEPVSAEGTLNQILLQGIGHILAETGHRPFFAPKTMQALRHNPESIRMMMTECAADAWVVLNSTRPLLESLAADFPVPVIAVGGPVGGLDIAAVRVDFVKMMRECVRRLVASGHERIVLAAYPEAGSPTQHPLILAFKEELACAGIKSGRYHVPDWDQTGEGFNALLRSLFTLTPPTALIVDDVRQVSAVYAFLATRRIPPRDLALVLLGSDPSLDWITPAPVFIRYDNDGLIRRVSDWVATLAAGGRDTEQVFCEATLVGDGFTPPPKA
jgi:DNA-binding LacI/PurR family transcriptional regulator